MAKNTKLKTCKYCGHEMAVNATTCPSCGGKNKKPLFKRIGFWAVAVLIGTAAIGCGSSDESKKVGEVNSSTPNTTVTENQTTETPQPVQEIYKVGDILHDGNMDIVYAASGDYNENEYLQPADGNKYIFLKFAFINTSDKSDTGISFYNFKCYADGYSCDAYYFGEEVLSATLSAGRSTMGNIYFEVPANASEIEIEYETNYITEEKITFAYEGNQDSGYVLGKNTECSEGALKVGDKVESSSLNITYLSCINDTADNMFLQPKDGYRYITCEFEFENLSKSDLVVSSISFDCYADGVYCDGAYFRDDALSATLSSGRKAKGTVTFEVPNNASVIEVEYLTNYWTSNRIVFDAKPE